METITISNGINCYTDASTMRVNDTMMSSAGYMIIADGKVINSQYTIIDHVDNSYGELYALFMGIKAVLKYSYRNRPINIFSDSMVSVDGLKTDVFRWHRESGTLLAGSGGKISYQNVYSHIIHEVVNHHMKINIYHIMSHMNLRYKEERDRFRTCFNGINMKDIGDDTIDELVHYNSLVDEMVKHSLKAFIEGETCGPAMCRNSEVAFHIPIDDRTLQQYAGLVNGAWPESPKKKRRKHRA